MSFARFLPMFAVVGDSFEEDILTASGQPYGRVNENSNWDAAGSENSALFVLSRYAVIDEDISAWHWVPAEYHGGLVEMNSDLGDMAFRSSDEAFEILIYQRSVLAGRRPFTVGLTFWPKNINPGFPRIKLQIEMINEVVIITYSP